MEKRNSFGVHSFSARAADDKHRRQRRIILAVASVAVTLFVTLFAVPFYRHGLTNLILCTGGHDELRISTAKTALKPATTVALEAHIMSKCPDALDCLRDLIVPTLERIASNDTRLSPEWKDVDFQVSYIGSSSPSGDVSCPHGPSECVGDMIQLCAAQLYPFPREVRSSLGFTLCLSRSYDQIPERDLVDHCALEHGLDLEKVLTCAAEDWDEEEGGKELLRESFDRSSQAGVRRSCTVRVQGETWCVRDGGEWKDCPGGHGVQDLVGRMEKVVGLS